VVHVRAACCPSMMTIQAIAENASFAIRKIHHPMYSVFEGLLLPSLAYLSIFRLDPLASVELCT
jgi:hypothetical protein